MENQCPRLLAIWVKYLARNYVFHKQISNLKRIIQFTLKVKVMSCSKKKLFDSIVLSRVFQNEFHLGEKPVFHSSLRAYFFVTKPDSLVNYSIFSSEL